MGILTFVWNGIPVPKEGENSWGLAVKWHLVSGPKRTDMPSQLWDFTAHFGRRNRLDSYRMMELDIDYVDHRSLLLDLRILLKTVPAVILSRGAW